MYCAQDIEDKTLILSGLTLGGDVGGTWSAQPITFGGDLPWAWFSLSLCDVRNWGRSVCSLSWHGRSQSKQWRGCLLVLFTPGQNGWTKAVVSAAVSDFFCVCEFVFASHPLINWLIDLWVLASGKGNRLQLELQQLTQASSWLAN